MGWVCVHGFMSPSARVVMFSVGERTEVLIFFEERIQQRDQACRAGTAFIRSTVLVGEHTAELEEQVGPDRGSLGVNWGLIIQGLDGGSSFSPSYYHVIHNSLFEFPLDSVLNLSCGCLRDTRGERSDLSVNARNDITVQPGSEDRLRLLCVGQTGTSSRPQKGCSGCFVFHPIRVPRSLGNLSLGQHGTSCRLTPGPSPTSATEAVNVLW